MTFIFYYIINCFLDDAIIGLHKYQELIVIFFIIVIIIISLYVAKSSLTSSPTLLLLIAFKAKQKYKHLLRRHTLVHLYFSSMHPYISYLYYMEIYLSYPFQAV